MYRRGGKRTIDLVFSVVAACLLAPVLLVVYLAVRLTSRGPGLFRQERLGRNARTFVVFKFRTMTDRPRVPSTIAVSDDDRDVTSVGRFLRRFKLDELPQILNVIAGHMSLVGPRPQLPSQLEDFTDEAKRRLEVRPGLTGMAQTHGNTGLSWPERWYYDAYYVDNLSFKLDCFLVWRTFLVLMNGEQKYLEHPPADAAALVDA